MTNFVTDPTTYAWLVFWCMGANAPNPAAPQFVMIPQLVISGLYTSDNCQKKITPKLLPPAGFVCPLPITATCEPSYSAHRLPFEPGPNATVNEPEPIPPEQSSSTGPN